MKRNILLIFALFIFIDVSGQPMWAGRPNLYPIEQEQSNWCWAACVEIVLENAGIPVTQYEIVSRVFGGAYNRDATQDQIMSALSGWGRDVYGYQRTLHCQQVQYGTNEIQHSLANGWPLIVGIRNRQNNGYHAVVLAAIDYYIVNGQVAIQSATLKDPWYGETINLSWNEFLNKRDGMYLKFWTQ